jgi:glycine/D-amino acid oxidase-like deaminating enzyme
MKKHIAIVGAGIYGVTVGLELSKHFDVTIFEELPDILGGASANTQARVHHGYHYPRGPETRALMQKTRASFMETYPEAIMHNDQYYYCIAKESQTPSEAFLDFCHKEGLKAEVVDLDLVSKDTIDLVIRVDESRFDTDILRKICWERLKTTGIALKLNTHFTADDFDRYDHTVVCTYANTNELLPEAYRRTLRFQLCEKLVVKLPPPFKGKSIVVFDGPFVAIDPYGKTPDKADLHLFGSVDHAIHHENIGHFSTHPAKYNQVLYKGLIKNPPFTHINQFIESARRFMPGIEPVEHIGSMFVIKALLPDEGDRIERPTVFERIDGRLSYVFAGKIANCVEIAKEVEADLASVLG